MRIGQTSFIVFVAKMGGSAIGFVSTIYFARELGATILGYYALTIALVAWLRLVGDLGVGSAMVKRMSEGEYPDAYATTSASLMTVISISLAGTVLVFGEYIKTYIGKPVVSLVAILLLIGLFESFGLSALRGERKVHVSGLLGSAGIGVKSLLQIGFVAVGFGLGGMLAGYAVGSVLVGITALSLLSAGFARPTRHHVRSLYKYAKFSWLGSLKDRSFNDVDILLLGVFVQSSFVGVYSVAWSLASFLTLFDSAVSSTLFPEFSRAEAEDSHESISNLIEQSLTFGGLFLIPGLFGAALLGNRLLRIYGSEFVNGYNVLWLLVLATMLYAYQKQFTTILNGIDRPDAAFRVNAVFIIINVVLNLVFIQMIGFVGAAIATVLSTGLGVLFAWLSLRSVVDFNLPLGEVGRQFAAAGIMSLVVSVAEILLDATAFEHSLGTVVVLVVVGVLTYFLTLFGISETFRTTVVNNVNIRPSLSG